jgi:hypothetical protein
MADWKQITARIRRARTGKDPAAQLSNLYQKTRDAMVAFELARHFETSGQNGEAAKWYSTAAERFRRADWKTKAREAADRLGGAPPETALAATTSDDSSLATPTLAMPEPGLPFAQNAAAFESIVTAPENSGEASSTENQRAPDRTEPARTRRRGRRGGRNRRKSGSAPRSSVSTAPESAALSRQPAPPPPVDEVTESRFSRVSESVPASRPASEATTESAAPLRGRYGDPGLSSRLTLLEMQFRRLLSCTPLSVGEADRAPAGPGVLLLTDSDLTSYYYVEPCDTLRIAIANLFRGSSRRAATPIKPQLAEHLGIAESRVSKYLADHCVVRYLQLDDDARYFAHFVIAVLRPALNE